MFVSAFLKVVSKAPLTPPLPQHCLHFIPQRERSVLHYNLRKSQFEFRLLDIHKFKCTYTFHTLSTD